MSDHDRRPRLVGINHVALDVGDIEEALAFYRRLFDFSLSRRTETSAVIDLGDQVLVLSRGSRRARDEERHFGLVVDHAEALVERLEAAGVERIESDGIAFLDPWGNRLEIVEYGEIPFLKSRMVLQAMELSHLTKSKKALEELENKGIRAPADA